MRKVALLALTLLLAVPGAAQDRCSPGPCPTWPIATPVGGIVVGQSNGDYSSIQDALDAAAPGDTILIYPGTYSESLTITQNNLTLFGVGSTGTVILSQDTEKVIDVSAYSGLSVYNMTLNVADGGLDDHAVYVTTGSVVLQNVNISLVTNETIVGANGFRGITVNGAGSAEWHGGTFSYTHTGISTNNVVSMILNSGGSVRLSGLEGSVAFNGGTALAVAFYHDTGAASLAASDIIVSVTGTSSTLITNDVNVYYLVGSGTARIYDHEATAWATSSGESARVIQCPAGSTCAGISQNNRITALATGGGGATAYAFETVAGATINSLFDIRTAASGWHIGGGAFTCVGDTGVSC